MQTSTKSTFCLFLLILIIGVANAFAGGAGTSGDPYQITTCAELQSMNTGLAAYYKLTTNIDCNVAPYNTGSGFNPVGCGQNEGITCGSRSFLSYFTGSLDGIQ